MRACAPATDPAAKAAFDSATRAIYRYSKWPTQAITYNLGKNAIIELREACKARIGLLVLGEEIPRALHVAGADSGRIHYATSFLAECGAATGAGSVTSRREFRFRDGRGRAWVHRDVQRRRRSDRMFRANVIAGDRSSRRCGRRRIVLGEIQRAFDVDRTMINLNNGGCSPTPSHVLEAMIRDLKFTNELPAEHMWRVLEPRIESVRRDLAREFGCDPEEMAITRNASEANEIMIMGLDLKRGDEVVVSNQNYGRMLTTWDQRVRREGIVLKQVSFKVPPPSQKYIFDQFKAAVTPKTQVIELPHITNLTGQIMPIREIVDFARPRGIEVIVDGAHASRTSRSRGTTSASTITARAFTSGCSRRSAPDFCT